MIELISVVPMGEVMMTTADDQTQTQLLRLVRYASQNADVATSKRDAAIREAQRAGASLRDIAAASGISHMRVKRIVERRADLAASTRVPLGLGPPGDRPKWTPRPPDRPNEPIEPRPPPSRRPRCRRTNGGGFATCGFRRKRGTTCPSAVAECRGESRV
jgi:hypothetical protein